MSNRQRLLAGRTREQWTGTGVQTQPYAGAPRRREGFAGDAGGCPTTPFNRNVNDARFSCQTSMCAEEPPVCGCNVIGANTFASDPTGLAAGTQRNLAIDAGDACRWQPRSLLIVAYEADVANPERLSSPIVQVPVLLLNATIGTIPMIRRTGANNFGIISDGYSDRKEITCVDWAPFTSVQNQGLTLSFLNIGANPIHIFNDIWGDNV